MNRKERILFKFCEQMGLRLEPSCSNKYKFIFRNTPSDGKHNWGCCVNENNLYVINVYSYKDFRLFKKKFFELKSLEKKDKINDKIKELEKDFK